MSWKIITEKGDEVIVQEGDLLDLLTTYPKAQFRTHYERKEVKRMLTASISKQHDNANTLKRILDSIESDSAREEGDEKEKEA